MKILVVNCGSATLKAKVIESDSTAILFEAKAEYVEHHVAKLTINADRGEIVLNVNAADPTERVARVLARIHEYAPAVQAVGHRVVHGGERYTQPIALDSQSLLEIDEVTPLAPLHNPDNLRGVHAAMALWPDAKHVAVFDTAFHSTLPEVTFRYAVPEKWYTDYHVRRYGFHGISHRYVARRVANYLGKSVDQVNLISLHLGNGASAAAVKQGRCVDTSMGMTPLEGLIMGTRSGDIDAAIPNYIADHTGESTAQILDALNRRSGLAAVGGCADMRALTARYQQGDERAKLAVRMYCYRIKKYIGAYFAVLGRVDGVVFTGGVGENSPLVRELACEGLDAMGVVVDVQKNDRVNQDVCEIGIANVRVIVVATQEEVEIANEVRELLF